MSSDDLLWCEIKTTHGPVKVSLQSFYLDQGVIKLGASIYDRFPLIFGRCSIDILRHRSVGCISGEGRFHFPIPELLGTVHGVLSCSLHAYALFGWEKYPSALLLYPHNVRSPSDVSGFFGRNNRSAAADWT